MHKAKSPTTETTYTADISPATPPTPPTENSATETSTTLTPAATPAEYFKPQVKSYIKFAKANGWVGKDAPIRDAFPISLSQMQAYLEFLLKRCTGTENTITYNSAFQYICALSAAHGRLDLERDSVFKHPSILKVRNDIKEKMKQEAKNVTKRRNSQMPEDKEKAAAATLTPQQQRERALHSAMQSMLMLQKQPVTLPPKSSYQTYRPQEDYKPAGPDSRQQYHREIQLPSLYSSQQPTDMHRKVASTTPKPVENFRLPAGGVHFVKFAMAQNWIVDTLSDWKVLFPLPVERLCTFLDFVCHVPEIKLKSSELLRIYLLHLGQIHSALGFQSSWKALLDNEIVDEKIQATIETIDKLSAESNELYSEEEKELKLKRGRLEEEVEFDKKIKYNEETSPTDPETLNGDSSDETAQYNPLPLPSFMSSARKTAVVDSMESSNNEFIISSRRRIWELESQIRLWELEIKRESDRVTFIESLLAQGKNSSQIDSILKML